MKTDTNLTIVVVILFGAGILFVTSAIENCPIVDTFKHVIHGDKIDWTGKNSPCSGSSSTIPSAKNYPAINGACPNGGTLTTDSSGLQVCQF
jgi:hypothetical protein